MSTVAVSVGFSGRNEDAEVRDRDPSAHALRLVALLATIPYKTFPKMVLGPIELRPFGVMVGLGVLVGAWVAARHIEQQTGIVRDETYRLAPRLVVFGVIGARITWDISHWSQ